MALSNWLTRDEWNAAFILGLVEFMTKENRALPNMSIHLRTGICQLAKLGYTSWHGIGISNFNDPMSIYKDENSSLGVNACVDNASCLAELIDGTFDARSRFEEFKRWAEKHTELDLTFAIETIEKNI